MTNASAIKNGKVWSRRYEVKWEEERFIEALNAVDPDGNSVLSAPLSLVLFRKIGGESSWAPTNKDERRKLATMTARALAAVLRRDEKNLLRALAIEAERLGTKVLLAQYSPWMIDLMSKGIAARTNEYSRPNVANVILAQIHK